MSNIIIPNFISYNELTNLNSLSPQSFKKFQMLNKNFKTVEELLINKEKGKEVGSFAYISKSNKYFIKTKALNNNYYLPILDDDSCVTPILPSSFKKISLEKGRILISIDSKLEVSFINNNLDQYMISGGIVSLEFNKDLVYYIFAFMKSNFFKSQKDMLPKGATIQHIKNSWLSFKIPLPPNKNILSYITLLVKAIIRKEEEIKNKHEKILKLIDNELTKNQKDNEFNYKISFNEINGARFDAAPYSIKSKKNIFLIDNYVHGKSTLKELKFKIIRGPNLAVQYIGKSITSNKYHEGFYTVIKPKHISKFGTIEGREYLGNKKELNLIEKGDIIFGAEGFKKGRSYIILHEPNKLITNYHGVILKHSENDLTTLIYIKCFLDYLRFKGMIDILGTGGNGGSFSPLYINKIYFPKFPLEKQKEISKLYYNTISFNPNLFNLNTFEKHDREITKSSGIQQLDSQIKSLKKRINEIFEVIVNNNIPDISFNFLFEYNL